MCCCLSASKCTGLSCCVVFKVFTRVEPLCTYKIELGWLLCVSKESSSWSAKLLISTALCDAGQEHGAQGGAARGQCLTACQDIALYCLKHEARALPPESGEPLGVAAPQLMARCETYGPSLSYSS